MTATAPRGILKPPTVFPSERELRSYEGEDFISCSYHRAPMALSPPHQSPAIGRDPVTAATRTKRSNSSCPRSNIARRAGARIASTRAAPPARADAPNRVRAAMSDGPIL
ncbi:hypothetical protein RhiJN_14501 [Ceratobasidium sp. AG-Ba]|nr:hypothetical protein RhiJN_14501 [Ceratobasidium sp. AG-Ba]QRW15044.1 hypothetical protein RhiLY_14043 [Ceratobasidium sp. AG-Ba]